MKNERYWEDIESHAAFKPNALKYLEAWNWLERLQTGGRLTQLDIICLKGLLDAVYSSGVNEDK